MGEGILEKVGLEPIPKKPLWFGENLVLGAVWSISFSDAYPHVGFMETACPQRSEQI